MPQSEQPPHPAHHPHEGAIPTLNKYDAAVLEPAILQFWKEKRIHEKLKERNKKGQPFYYLDGPPYTSGKVHVGTAWGKSLRDMAMRYKRMQGFDVWDRAGFDMHGLPTENKVMAKLGIARKEDIEAFGVEAFNRECEKYCVESMHTMIADFKRMGVWMGFENPYQPITEEFIDAEWWLIKRAHEKGRLYQGNKVMSWCPRCATSLSKHELEYKTVTDNSIFLKFKVTGTSKITHAKQANEFLIVWTTTPWTIPFNMAVMVNPEVEYLRAKIKSTGEVWIVAKALAGVLINGVVGEDFEIQEEFLGEKLLGMTYEHPFKKAGIFDQFADNRKVHSVVLSAEFVDTSAGSGLVHCAPGCGPEDFEVGKREDIPAFNSIDEYGVFPQSMGEFTGLTAKQDDAKFVDMLRESKALIETTPVEHEYAHCWRCHGPIVFRLTDQWFFRMEDAKETLIAWNKKVHWVPDAAFNAFESWLKNLKDNGITRQRYWGTPVPIWMCDSCGKYDVIGSTVELKEKAGRLPENLHKPWIDEITIPCACQVGAIKRRIPDILDVWIDAGTVSWSCLDYPRRTDLFERYFPADFILEGKDQIRGWYNLLFVASFLAFEKPSFKAVYMHGFINDSLGRKMSKSLGNQISPFEVIDKHGADTMRYYMIGASQPGIDMSYNFDDMALKQKNLLILWNLHKFLIEQANTLKVNPSTLALEDVNASLDLEERYILSRLHSTLKAVTEAFDSYHLSEIPDRIEKLYLDVSRTYVQIIRDKIQSGDETEKAAVLFALYQALSGAVRMLAPITPFISEYIHQQFRANFALDLESVHEAHWQAHDPTLINESLERQFEEAYAVIGAGLSLREKLNLGVRWPLPEIVISTTPGREAQLDGVKDLILKQLNVKHLVFGKIPVGYDVAPNTPAIAKEFKQDTEKVFKLVQHHKIELAKQLEAGADAGTAEHPLQLDGLPGVSIRKEHLMIKELVPEPYLMAQLAGTGGGMVFLNTKMTPELEAEGYARELTRRVQQLRKAAGLSKQDRISLGIVLDTKAQVMLEPYFRQIEEKVGSAQFTLTERPPEHGAYTHKSDETIKGRKFQIHLKAMQDR